MATKPKTIDASVTEPVTSAPAPELPKFEVPTFEMPKVEIPAVVREMAEKSVQSAKDFYEKMRNAAEETTDLLEDGYTASAKGATEIGMKVLDAARTNTNATFDFIASLMGVKSVSQAIELQTAHARRQLDALSSQAKDLATAASKVSTEAAKPYQALASKALQFPTLAK